MSEVEELQKKISDLEAQMKIDRKFSNGHLCEKINSRDKMKDLRAEAKVDKQRIEDLELIVGDSLAKFDSIDKLFSGIVIGRSDKSVVIEFMHSELIGLMISRCEESLKNGQ